MSELASSERYANGELTRTEVYGAVGLGGLALLNYFGPLVVMLFLASFGVVALKSRITSVLWIFRYPLLAAIPIFDLITALWSAYRGLTIRYAVQLFITMAFAVLLAKKTRGTTVLLFSYAALTLGVLLCFPLGTIRSDGVWIGIFGSKNAYAYAVSLFCIFGLGVFLERSYVLSLRLAGLVGAIGGIPMMLLGKSAGATLTLIPIMVLMFLLQSFRRLAMGQRLLMVLLAVILMMGGAVIWLGFGTEIMRAILESQDKDVTLTGRTDLWDIGYQIFQRNFFGGIGYQAFWVQGNSLAEALWLRFDIESRMGFNFHNTYLNHAVETGLIGVTLTTSVFLLTLYRSCRNAVLFPSGVTVAFAALALSMFIRSFAEVAFFFQCGFETVLLIYAYVYTADMAAEAKRLRRREKTNEFLTRPLVQA